MKEDTNEQLVDKYNTIQDLNRLEDKEEKFNEETEIKKIENWEQNEMKPSIKLKKKLTNSLKNRVDQGEDRLSEFEDKVDD